MLTYFIAQLRWNTPTSAIIFDKKLLNAPLKQPNKELFNSFEIQAKSALHTLKGSETYTDKVIRIINEYNLENNIKIEQVALHTYGYESKISKRKHLLPLLFN